MVISPKLRMNLVGFKLKKGGACRFKNETTDISQTSAFLLDIQLTLVRQSTAIGDSSYNQREKYYTALKRKDDLGLPRNARWIWFLCWKEARKLNGERVDAHSRKTVSQGRQRNQLICP